MRCQQRYRVVFERHDTSPKSNTIISINVMAVTSGKHSEHDTEHSEHDTEYSEHDTEHS